MHDLQVLNPGGEASFNKVKGATYKELFKPVTSTKVKPVVIKRHLVKLPLTIGSKDSAEFHYQLYNLNETYVKIFETETIHSYIEYKAAIGIGWYLLYTAPYMALLACLTAGVSYPSVISIFFFI